MENDNPNSALMDCIKKDSGKISTLQIKEDDESSKIDSDNNEVKLETKACVRPKILPPEPETRNDNREECTLGGLIRLQTRNRKPLRMKPYSSGGAQDQVFRSRYLVQLKNNNSNMQSSVSSVRQVLEQRVQRVQRCRDFDELGYCLLGNDCSLWHGNNTIVVNDLPTYAPQFNSSVQLPHYERNSDFHQRLPRQRTSSFLVRKIPNDCNNIFKINEYFGQFGEIKHIQVSFDAVDTALVTYEDTESATRAFRSKDPIFNNRFVSLKWYSAERDVSASVMGQASSSNIKNNISAQLQESEANLRFQNRSNFSKTFKNSVLPLEPLDSLSTVNTLPPTPAYRRPSRQAKYEKLLSLKTDLYLKLNEQARLALLKAQSAPDGECKREWMKKVDNVQTSLADVRQTITVLHEKMQRGVDNKLANNT